ncbi:WD40/YVTN/BNR-like repeat-containing protein [Natronomonas sp.]|uniref:WD40/YVTN/BNR-like repeat-containing protein n=1 Tax=Natronomonas sp. TaxID=2184060 RepID=UPI002FC37E0B
MNLLLGARTGVFRGRPEAVEAPVRVLDCDRVLRVRAFGPRVYAATRSGLYRSLDGGRSWNHIETPRPEVYSVLEAPVGERLYVGTHPAHVYVSEDAGESWAECETFQELPSREEWYTPRHRNESHVRALRSAGGERIVAGVEVGGVHLSEDGGETWTERRQGVHDDVHHVLVQDAEEWVASTGTGLYRTRDSGRSWTRLDGDLDRRYFREAFSYDGRLYAAATAGPPPTWDGPKGTDAALYESCDGGDTLEPVEYAGAPGEFVLSWAAADGNVYAGTTGGLLLRREPDGWLGAGSISAEIGSLAAVE